MPDTTKLIIGIALAVLVVALITWLFASARRREAEARRLEAEAVRAKLAERIPVVQEREDRASVTARIAEEARREAEAAAAEAARLEHEAAEHRAEAHAARSDQDELARLADHIDPDVRTDDEGYRVDDSGRRLSGSTVASALGMAALAQDDEEPDLADHENPFPGYAAEPTPESSVQNLPPGSAPERAESEHSTVGEDAGDPQDPDWVNSPVDEDAADELEAQAAVDAGEADWINGPDDEPDAESEHSSGLESSAQNLPLDSAGQGAESGHSSGLESSAQNLHPGSGAESEHSSLGEVDEGAPFDDVDEEPSRPSPRRVSGLDEVVDGGFGVGSAAPIEDGAQPLGHPIMGYRETRTFLVPEALGYGDTDPDVWFYDEDAARRSGFHAAGED
jgi:hypothetical protein